MADLINLNKARKSAAKAADEAKARQNRARFGQTKAAKVARQFEADKMAEKLSQSKREP